MKEQPIKKAWKWIEPGESWYTAEHISGPVYADTPGQAKYNAYVKLDWVDDGFEYWCNIQVRRMPEYDQYAPRENELLQQCTEKQRKIIAHAHGNESNSPGFRNHYVTGQEHPDLLALVTLGIFSGPHIHRLLGEWQAYFYLTDLGKEVARSMLPRRRAA